MEDKHYDNSALYQQIEQYFKPAKGWEDCQLPMTSHELFNKLNETLPGCFEDFTQMKDIVETLGFTTHFNENNNKYYWLVNPA